MQKQLQEVLDFHQKFDVYSNTTPTINLPHDAYLLRKHIMQEEVSEYSEEYEREGLSDDERLQAVAKELADIIYTALGTVIAHGLQDKFEQKRYTFKCIAVFYEGMERGYRSKPFVINFDTRTLKKEL